MMETSYIKLKIWSRREKIRQFSSEKHLHWIRRKKWISSMQLATAWDKKNHYLPGTIGSGGLYQKIDKRADSLESSGILYCK